MSTSYRPFASSLPGIEKFRVAIDQSKSTAVFVDPNCSELTLRYCFWRDDSGRTLTIIYDDQTLCSFRPCPPPHESLWFATGLVVNQPRRRIASHMYALARDLLRPIEVAITPSENLTANGVSFWQFLDPNVHFIQKQGQTASFEPVCPS